MSTFQRHMREYKKQLQKGVIQQAYLGLMTYLHNLKTRLAKQYPDHAVSGSLYFGYMDMSYFTFTPPFFKDRQLKIAIVFLHEEYRFDVWLAANNKGVQTQYWEWFRARRWNKYRIVATTQGEDSILEYTLVKDPDFGDLDALTQKIEKGALKFIADIEDYLVKHDN